jgi:hypothetical protein
VGSRIRCQSPPPILTERPASSHDAQEKVALFFSSTRQIYRSLGFELARNVREEGVGQLEDGQDRPH